MEEQLLVLLAIAVIAAPVLLIIFMVWTVSLSKRVRALEDALQTGAQPVATPPADATAPRPAAPGEPATVEGPWAARTTGDGATGPDAPSAPEPAATPAPRPDTPPKAIVLRADRARALAGWFRVNWIYAVSAVSLALAGIFLLQYGIETGYLTPSARVIAALAFGLALVGAGEYIRRRWGDQGEVASANLPSVFSGAGIVILFGAVLAALHLYQLVSPTMALIGLVAVAAAAIGLGWFSGPLLAAIGITGAFVAPFVVGGESDAPELFYLYFGLVAAVGLAIDAGRRWAWVSVLTLALGYPAATMLHLSIGEPEYFSVLLVVLVAAALAIPSWTLAPRHGGAAVVESFLKARPRGWPAFPTRLAAGAVAASVAGLGLASLHSQGGFWIALIGLEVVFFALAAWAVRAEALEDLAVLPALALVALPVVQALGYETAFRDFLAVLTMEEGTPIPRDPYFLVGFAVVMSLGAAWRSRAGARWPVAWAAGAALVAPAMVAGVEFTWAPARAIGAYPWALTALAVAALMTALALVFARDDGEAKPRVAGFVLAALALIAFALTLVLTKTALTLALAVTTLAAAGLDRRFRLSRLAVAGVEVVRGDPRLPAGARPGDRLGARRPLLGDRPRLRRRGRGTCRCARFAAPARPPARGGGQRKRPSGRSARCLPRCCWCG